MLNWAIQTVLHAIKQALKPERQKALEQIRELEAQAKRNFTKGRLAKAFVLYFQAEGIKEQYGIMDHKPHLAHLGA